MSSIVEHAKKIVADNNLSDVVEIIRGKVRPLTRSFSYLEPFFYLRISVVKGTVSWDRYKKIDKFTAEKPNPSRETLPSRKGFGGKI